MVEDLGFTRLRLGDEGLIENVEDILADTLEFGLDLLAVVANDANMLIGALGLFLLLDGGDNAPRGTSGSNDVLVSDGEQVSLVDSKFTTDLNRLILGYA